MRIRKLTHAAATVVVALIVALAVPVSQLRTISVVTECCCPDPAKCHCPDHKPDHSKLPSIRACHKSVELASPAPAPAAAHVVVAIELSPAVVTGVIEHVMQSPHVPPDVDRQSGPS